MRSLFAVIAVFAVLIAAPAMAAPLVFDTPKALLDYAYQPYATGDFKDDTDELYTSELKALFADADANTPDDSVGPVDFDVFVNAQDYQVTDLSIGGPTPEGPGVSVPVSLKNFGEAESLVFHLIKQGGGWKINDIESLTPGATWRLTTLLTPDDSGGGDGSTPAGPDAGDGGITAGEGAADSPPAGN